MKYNNNHDHANAIFLSFLIWSFWCKSTVTIHFVMFWKAQIQCFPGVLTYRVTNFLFPKEMWSLCYIPANDKYKIFNSTLDRNYHTFLFYVTRKDNKITKQWNEKQPLFEIHLSSESLSISTPKETFHIFAF